MERRKMLASLVALVVLLCPFFITQADAADKVVKIGNIEPLSGPSAAVGQQGKFARDMAVEEINAAGGILGKKIELFIGDTEGKPEKGITALKKLVMEDKVDVLVGEYSSGVSLAMQPFLPNYKIVFVTTGCASLALTDNVK